MIDPQGPVEGVNLVIVLITHETPDVLLKQIIAIYV